MNRIKALALDVDGVLTDGGVWWGPDGQEWKRFHFADIMGVSLARKSGLVIALISGEDSPLVDRFAAKLSIQYVAKGCKDKAAAVRLFSEQAKLDLSEICFMGDDVNDLGAMEITGFCAAPSNAQPQVLQYAGFIASNTGGNGAVREIVEAILLAKSNASLGTY